MAGRHGRLDDDRIGGHGSHHRLIAMTIPSGIPTPAQIEALAAGFQRVGRFAQDAADTMVYAFAAAARQLELERRKRPSFTVIVPTKATADWFGRWLFAPNPVPAYFGRKRRARRARGRRIERWCITPAQMFHAAGHGSGGLTVAQWAAAHRTMRNQQGGADEADQDRR